MVVRERGMFANCTNIIVSLLKAWKVTVVDRVLRYRHLTLFQEGPHRNSSFMKKKIFLQNSASKLANWDILKYLY